MSYLSFNSVAKDFLPRQKDPGSYSIMFSPRQASIVSTARDHLQYILKNAEEMRSQPSAAWLIRGLSDHSASRDKYISDSIVIRLVISEHFDELLCTYETWLPLAAEAFADNTKVVEQELREDVMSAAVMLASLFRISKTWKGYPSEIVKRIVSCSLKMFALLVQLGDMLRLTKVFSADKSDCKTLYISLIDAFMDEFQLDCFRHPDETELAAHTLERHYIDAAKVFSAPRMTKLPIHRAQTFPMLVFFERLHGLDKSLHIFKSTYGGRADSRVITWLAQHFGFTPPRPDTKLPAVDNQPQHWDYTYLGPANADFECHMVGYESTAALEGIKVIDQTTDVCACTHCGASHLGKGSHTPKKACSACTASTYCNAVCQSAAWKAGHKKACNRLATQGKELAVAKKRDRKMKGFMAKQNQAYLNEM